MKIISKEHIIDIIYLIIIAILTYSAYHKWSKQKELESTYIHNIQVLNDSIKVVNLKNGNILYEKGIIETNYKNLKLYNNSLKNKLDSLNVKSPTTAITTTNTIYLPKVDTLFRVDSLYINKYLYKTFEFTDKYRYILASLQIDSIVNLSIDKEIINFDYTIAVTKDKNIIINSSNPYVKINNIDGFQLPKEKKKHLFIGPSINVGYDPLNNIITPNIGVSLVWGIFGF